jgi:ABC-type sugar transport system substrate-binding protein
LKKGIPVVFVDTKGTNACVSFIGTNNEVGAKMAADYICKGVPKGSEVAILQGIITQSTGKARSDGAQAGLAACGLKVVAVQPGDWDTAKGQAATENILTAHPNIKGIFASNDNMAMGAIEALRSAKKLKNVMVVGFDGTPAASKAILAGELRIPEDQIEVDRPFAEMGLNSVMAISIRRQLEQFVGIPLSATMLFNHPTISSFADYLAIRLVPGMAGDDADADEDPAGSVLDSLFDTVESTS